VRVHFCITNGLDSARVQKGTDTVRFCIRARPRARMMQKCTLPSLSSMPQFVGRAPAYLNRPRIQVVASAAPESTTPPCVTPS
jgi:hypothetical protein